MGGVNALVWNGSELISVDYTPEIEKANAVRAQTLTEEIEYYIHLCYP